MSKSPGKNLIIFSTMLFLLLIEGCDYKRESIFDPGSLNYEPRITSVTLEQNNMVVKCITELGRVQWIMPFENPVSKFVVHDLTGDDNPEIILGFEGRKPGAGYVKAYDINGKLIVSIPPPAVSIYPHIEEGGRFVVGALHVDDLDSDGQPEIITTRHNDTWFQTEMSIWTAKGDSLSSFWHPGQFSHIDIVDMDLNGFKELILYGQNNDMKSYTIKYQSEDKYTSNYIEDEFPHFVAILEYPETSGQAPPWLGVDYVKAKTSLYLILYPAFMTVSTVAADELILNSETEQDGSYLDLRISTGLSTFWWLSKFGKILNRAPQLKVPIGSVENPNNQAIYNTGLIIVKDEPDKTVLHVLDTTRVDTLQNPEDFYNN